MSDFKTREEVVSAIAERAKDTANGGDNFRVKIERRRSAAAMPELIATLDDATVDNFATPESWLPNFVGGGILTLKAFHATDQSRMIGLLNDTFPGMPRDPDLSVFDKPDWKGPRTLVFPQIKKAVEPQTSHYAAPVVPAVGNNAPMPRSLSGGADGGGLPNDVEARLAAKFEAIQRAELDLADRRKTMEVDAAKREADTRIRAAEDKVKDIERQLNEMRRAPPIQTGPSATDNIVALMAQMRQSDIEAKRADREMSIKLAELQQQAQIESAKLNAEATRAAAAANQTLLTHLLAKPAIDPAIMEMMAKNDTSKVLADMSSVVTASMSNQLNVMSAMMEMGYGNQKESGPVQKIMKESGWDKAAKILTPIISRAFAVQQGNAQPGQVLQQPPQQFPQQTQALPPVQPAQPQQAPQPAPVQGQPTIIEQIADAIKTRKGSAKEIAEGILHNINDPSFIKAATAAGGDPRVLFDQILGEWLDDAGNRIFAGEVLRITMEQGCASGIFPEETKAAILGMVQSLIESEVAP